MEKLNSVLKNQPLRLALKALILTVALAFSLSKGETWLSVATILLASWFYFRPAINLDRFWLIYAINLILIFMVPFSSVERGVSLLALGVFAIVAFIILGIKNLVIIKRFLAYQIASLLLISELTFFFFAGFLNIWATLIAIIIFFLLIREQYYKLASKTHVIYPIAVTLVYSQLLWSVSVLPITHVIKSAFVIAIILLGNNLIVHRIKDTLSRKIVLRNAIILVFVLIIIFVVGDF